MKYLFDVLIGTWCVAGIFLGLAAVVFSLALIQLLNKHKPK